MRRLVFVLLLLIDATLARAQGPTPTPTPTATPYAIPTGQYSDLRPTPSPFSITPAALSVDFDFGNKAGEFADQAINAWRWLNFGGVIDWIIFVMLGLFTLRALAATIQDFRGD